MGTNEQSLSEEPIGKLLPRLALPTVFAQLINLLYNIVDRVYVGHIPEIGSMALAGLGVCFPVIILISAFAYLVGQGGAPRAAMALGAGDREQAGRILGTATVFLILTAIVLTAVFLPSMEPILLLFGASETTIPYALSYLRIYVLGTIFVQLALGLNQFISCQGYATTAMKTVLIGAVINIILDPVLIFVFDMGVAGAALATVLSQTVSAVWVVAFLGKSRAPIHFEKRFLKIDRKVLAPVLGLGISPFIMQATECLIQLVFNTGMQKYGNDYYVSVMAILFSLSQVMWLPMQGICMGATPIISYNYGAGNMERVRAAFRLLFLSTVLYSLVFTGMFLLFPDFFMMFFTSDPQVKSLGARAMRIYLFGFLFMGAQSACQQSFLALGQARISMFLALLRKVILLTPLALILPVFFGTDGLLIAEPVSDMTAIAVTTFTFWRFSRKAFRAEQGKEMGTAGGI